MKVEQVRSMSVRDENAAETRDPRESMLLMAPMRLLSEAGTPMTLRVRNLSAGGLMAECDRLLVAGERIEVDLRNVGAVEGEIVWAVAGRIGVRFDRAIDPKLARRPVGTGVGTSKIIVGLDGKRPGFR